MADEHLSDEQRKRLHMIDSPESRRVLAMDGIRIVKRPRWWCHLRRHWRTDGFFTGGRERFSIDGRCAYCGAEVR